MKLLEIVRVTIFKNPVFQNKSCFYFS